MTTGMVVLQEYRAVSSWPGLGATVVSMLTGIIMLVTGPDAASSMSAAVDVEDGSLDRKRPTTPTTPTLLQNSSLQRKCLHAANDAGGVVSPREVVADAAGFTQGSPRPIVGDIAGSPLRMRMDVAGDSNAIFADIAGSNASLDCKAQNSMGDLCWCFLPSQVLPHASGICCLNHAHWQAMNENATGNCNEAIAGAMRSGGAIRAGGVANTVRRWRTAVADEATRALAQARVHAGLHAGVDSSG
eukprot:CAMPEP_0172689916 /NCGR_PEP_ID=MMETSP1074-20121228/23485_1 /TAXON_ID=2916 /ORGANISM="Ceratium fusus, Strain PA161109" /LENGTH=243 /DNA_ID=CAMNT_0013509799 /DNA_START=839 /DNA_END=1570 /DNA_ORIENTATION=-